MAENRSVSIRPGHTGNDVPSNLRAPKYGGNREFTKWWEHWMSKVPDSRFSQKSTRAVPNKASYYRDSDDTTKQEDAA